MAKFDRGQNGKWTKGKEGRSKGPGCYHEAAARRKIGAGRLTQARGGKCVSGNNYCKLRQRQRLEKYQGEAAEHYGWSATTMVMLISGIIKMDCDFCAWELDLRSEGTSISRGLQWEMFGMVVWTNVLWVFWKTSPKSESRTWQTGIIRSWVSSSSELVVGEGWKLVLVECPQPFVVGNWRHCW